MSERNDRQEWIDYCDAIGDYHALTVRGAEEPDHPEHEEWKRLKRWLGLPTEAWQS